MEEDIALDFNKLDFPSLPKYALCQIWLKLAQGCGKEVKNMKSLQRDGQTDGQTYRQSDIGQKVIRKAHMSFQFR